MCKRNDNFQTIIAVTNRKLCGRPFLEQIGRICEVHPAAVLLREKDLPREEYQKLAGQVKKICERYGVTCILHFYPEAAEALGSRNLHLPLYKLREFAEGTAGTEPGREASGRSLKVRGAGECGKMHRDYDILGCSVHSVEEAVEAESLGATYLTAGHIYATDCKMGVPPRGLAFLREICERVTIPVYAIGGIGLEDREAENEGMGREEREAEYRERKGVPDERQMREIYAQGAAGACIMSGMMRL